MSKVSIIVPVYNSEKTISRTIDSIVNQSYENLEILLINDGSKDNSLSIIESYSDSRIRVLSHENHGVSYTRNRGLDEMTGDFVMFVDADDWIETNTVEHLMNILKREHVDVVEFGYKRIRDGNTFYQTKFKEEKMDNRIEIMDKFLNCDNAAPYVCTKIYRADLFDGLRFGKYSLSEDFLMNIQLIYRSLTKFVTPGVYYNYCYEEDSATNQGFSSKNFEPIKVMYEIIDVFEKDDDFKIFIPKINVYILLNCQRIYRILRDSNIEDESYYKLIKKEFNKSYSKTDFKSIREVGSPRTLPSILIFKLSPELYYQLYKFLEK